MVENLPTITRSFEHRQVLSAAERLAESKGPLLVYSSLTAVALIVGFLGGVIAPLICLCVDSAQMSVCGLVLFILLIGVTALLSFAGLGVCRNKQALELSTVEERLHEGLSQNVWADIEHIIASSLKLKRYDDAEFYSQRMLELSHGASALSDVLVSTECWASSRKYQDSVRYWLIWLFESRGTLSMTTSRLRLKSRRLCFDISLGDIVSVDLKAHPRWLKPIPMNYLAVTFWADGETAEVFLSPSISQGDSVFQVNSTVRSWYGKIAKGREKYEKRVWTGAERTISTNCSAEPATLEYTNATTGCSTNEPEGTNAIPECRNASLESTNTDSPAGPSDSATP